MEKRTFHPAFLVDQNGNTIFHAGAQQGQKKVCKAAVRYGAALDAQNDSGRRKTNSASKSDISNSKLINYKNLNFHFD